jgi:hypothetical protein
LRLPVEILISPKRAFADIVVRPEWVTAYGVLLVGALLQFALIGPGALHLHCVPMPDGTPVPKTPDAFRTELNQYVTDGAVNVAIFSLVEIGLTAMVLTSVSRFKGATTSYGAFASLAANCLVPSAIGNVLSGAAAALRPATSFTDCKALVTALPDNLAIFANPAHTSEVLFLAGPDVFTIWSAILLAYGFAALAPVKFVTALAVSFALAFAFSIVLG